MQKQFPSLFKIDTKGKVREWRMEVNGDQYRTIAGLKDGKQVVSGWTTAKGKSVGRSNETSAEDQAVLEVESQYTKKLHGEYHSDIKNIDEGAKFFEPMLAQKWDKRKDKIKFGVDKVYFQPKLDGIRNIQTSTMSQSRTGHEILAVPFLADLFAPLFAKYPDTILDGELYNHELKENFNEITSIVRKTKPTVEDTTTAAQMIQYHVYDLPSCDAAFGTRYNKLRVLMAEFNDTTIQFAGMTLRFGDVVKVVETTDCVNVEEVDLMYGSALGDGYEGGIIRLDGKYEQKRSSQLLKRKEFEDAEFTIIRIEEGNGNWAGLAKRVFFKNDLDGRECGAGLKGSKAYAKHVLDNAASYIGKQATIQFFTRTPDGVPRFPIAKVLHTDKRW